MPQLSGSVNNCKNCNRPRKQIRSDEVFILETVFEIDSALVIGQKERVGGKKRIKLCEKKFVREKNVGFIRFKVFRKVENKIVRLFLIPLKVSRFVFSTEQRCHIINPCLLFHQLLHTTKLCPAEVITEAQVRQF